MFVLLLTAQAKNFSSELTKMDFFLPGTLHVCMIRNLQPNYALTPPKHLSFSVSSSAIHLHIDTRVSRSHSKTQKNKLPT